MTCQENEGGGAHGHMWEHTILHVSACDTVCSNAKIIFHYTNDKLTKMFPNHED